MDSCKGGWGDVDGVGVVLLFVVCPGRNHPLVDADEGWGTAVNLAVMRREDTGRSKDGDRAEKRL